MRNTTLILLALGLFLAACPPAEENATPDTGEETAAVEGHDHDHGEEGDCPHAKHHGEGHHGKGHHSPFQSEGVDAKVENLDNGVKMTFTSEDAELVGHIQEHMNKEEGAEGCKCDCPCKWEGVTRTAENLANGITVTLTSEDAELVTKVQEHVAKMAEGEGCGGHEGHAHGEGHGCTHGGEHPWSVLHSDAVTRAAENLDNGVKVTFTAGCPHLQGEIKKGVAAKVEHMAAKAEGGERACKCPVGDEGVTVTTEEIDNGAALVATSEDAEQVTKLQEWGAKKASGEGCGCGHHGEEAEKKEGGCGCGKHGEEAPAEEAPADTSDGEEPSAA